MKKLMILSLLLSFIACSKAQNTTEPAKVAETEEVRPAPILTGDLQTEAYFPLLEGKRIGVYSNQTGMAGEEHIVDLLKRSGFNIVYILSPEHGFRGDADAGRRWTTLWMQRRDCLSFRSMASKGGSPMPRPCSRWMRW